MNLLKYSLALVGLLSGCAGPITRPQIPSGGFTQQISSNHLLYLPTPLHWKARVEIDSKKLPTIHIIDPSDSSFKIMVTAFQVQKGDNAVLRHPPEIKVFTELQGTFHLADSVEKKVDIVEISSEKNIGFFYTLTDRRASLPKNEYRKVCQGFMSVGELRLGITILYQPENNAVVDSMFNILKQARDIE